jgi:hypothetical protein
MFLFLRSTTPQVRPLQLVLFTLFALTTLATAAPATAAPSAAKRYVSITGNDWGNGTCALATPCRTIKYAIAISLAGDKISIGSGTFNEHDIKISKNLKLIGNGIRNTVVNGQGIDSVFEVLGGVTATLKGMRIKNGSANTPAQGGGILNLGKLTVKNVTLSDNTAQAGGGIFNNGNLTLTKSTLYNNVASGHGGGLYTATSKFALVTQSNIQLNTANLGGGIANYGSLLLFHSAVHGTPDGGGITNGGSAILLNVTVSGNANPGTGGAGISTTGGSMDLHYVTLSNNAGYAIQVGKGSVVLYKSIVYNNASNQQCGTIPIGSFSDGGYNVLADQSCSYFPGTGSIIANPKLKPLAYNNSPTPTHALMPASPAVDLVPVTKCTPQDQRGVKRPVEGDGIGKARCDAGAHEYP